MLRTGLALCVVLLFGLGRLIVPWRWLERTGWALLLRAFRVKVRVHGVPVDDGALLLANHVSWIDIAALGHAVPAAFVAKSEVAGWPLIGTAARRIGCLFVDRASRVNARGVAAQIAARLVSGKGVIVFPEGTTGPGDGVLRFQSTLVALPGTGQPKIQPVALVYRDESHRRAAAWLGDASLLPHALKLARGRGITLEIWFEAPFAATDRKQAARHAEAIVAERLRARLCCQAETLKRAA